MNIADLREILKQRMGVDLKTHKTDHWYQLTHWEKPNKSKCGKEGVTRWHWKNVSCKKCLKLRTAQESEVI